MPFATARDGTRLRYETFGERTGEPLLLIQGLGADARGWLLQRWALRRYRCIAFDNRGVGGSDRPERPYDLTVIAEGAVAVIVAADDRLRGELTRLDVPTLVVVGTQDILTPLADAEELAELIPGAELVVIPRAGHGVMGEQPRAFNRAVLEFLGRQPGTASTREEPTAASA